MNSFYYGTPYNLKKKLKNLNKYALKKNPDINILYKDINDSIPALTNSFCFLKNRTIALNKSVNKLPIIYTNFITKNSNYNSYSRMIRTSPNISSNFDNNYSYLSPKPVLKPYINNKNNNIFKAKNNILKYKNMSNNLLGNNKTKTYNQINLHYKFNSDIYNPLIKYKLNYNKNNNNNKKNSVITKLKKNTHKNNYNNKNYSAINMLRDNYKYHKIKNYSINNGDNNIKNNSEINNDSFKKQRQKLNEKIDEKDKIIFNMQGIINETFYKLNQKDKENSLLKSEIFELKSKNNYELNKGFIDTNSNINFKESNKNENYNNINGRIKKNKHKRIIYVVNNNKNKDKNYNKKDNKNNNNRKKDNNEVFDRKWEEIRKLNKKLDNLLYKGENKLKKYEKIQKNSKV